MIALALATWAQCLGARNSIWEVLDFTVKDSKCQEKILRCFQKTELGFLVRGRASCHMVLDLFFSPCSLLSSRLNPDAAPPLTRLPTPQAPLAWALLAMAPLAPRTQASPAADKTPHLPLASSPLSPPKEPLTHLGAAPPTLRTLPTPAGAE